MSKYLRPNWHAINKAILSPEERKELNKELNDLTEKIRTKMKAQWQAEEQARKEHAIVELKCANAGTMIYYKGHDIRLFGKGGPKRGDARKYMLVEVDGKNWKCPYVDLTLTEIPEAEIRTKQRLHRILTENIS